MMVWIGLHPSFRPEHLGFIPSFLNERDPRPAKEQLGSNYQGGWDSFEGFTIRGGKLFYPGDPPLHPLAETKLRDEVIRLYEYEWVVVIQPDGSFEACRMD